MRILIVTQYFWPESFLINDLALGLRQRGHDVTVLTGLPNYPSGRLAPGYSWRGPWNDALEDIQVVRVPLITRGTNKGTRLVLNYGSFAASASLLADRRVEGEVDVVFVYEVSPITVALPAIRLRRTRKVPVVLWVQDLWPDVLAATGVTASPVVLRLAEKMTAWIHDRCDRILTTSEAFIPRLLVQGVPERKLAYLPQWAEGLYRPVDLEADAREWEELPPGFKVLFAGNIGTAQAFETLLAAADRLRHETRINWVIVGDGRQRDWLLREVAARRLDGSIHLLGRQPPERMPRYLAAADALLVSLRDDPLYSWTVPAKLQAYLACAKPVVAALSGEGARIVEESGAGLVAGAENPDRLAASVLELFRMSSEERELMGARGRVYFEKNFEREQVLGRLEGFLIHAVDDAR